MNFRDKVLLASSVGNAFVEWYYRVSPPIADVISRHRVLSAGGRIMLLPAIGLAWLYRAGKRRVRAGLETI
jgi:hypothetical protein